MLKKRNTVLIIAVIAAVVLLQSGCSIDKQEQKHGIQSMTEAVADDANKEGKSISFERLLYTKYSPDFSLVQGDEQVVPQAVMDKYEDYKRVVPGGFVIDETDTEYFLCVSVGKKDSGTEGFDIKSLTLSGIDEMKDPILHIMVTPTRGENSSDAVNGEAFITSLIRVPKDSLPQGAAIHAISMVGS